MEHIIQFAIGIDDEAIRQRVIETAEKKIMETITFDVRKQIFQKHYYKQDKLTDDLQYWVEEKVEHILEDCKDAIIERAAEKLADKLSRTKKAKEALNDVVENL